MLALLLFVGLNARIAQIEPDLFHAAAHDAQAGFLAEVVDNYFSAPRADILFMGSSRVEFGLNPALFEQEYTLRTGQHIRALNLGMGGGNIDAEYLLLKNVVSDAKKPATIIYGLTEIELYALAPGTRLAYMSTLLRPGDASLVAPPDLRNAYTADGWLNTLSPLYRDRDLIRNALSMRFDPLYSSRMNGPTYWNPPSSGFPSLPEGYIADAKTWQAEQANYEPKLYDWQTGGLGVASLHAFLDLAKARGIQVILVDMPVSPLQLSWWGPGRLQVYLRDVSSLAESSGVPLIDLYADPSSMFPQDRFIDTNHLNKEGSTILTTFVADHFASPASARLTPRTG
jgi:hypothetical protein